MLVGSGEEEAAHLALQWIFNLHIDVVAGRFLLVVGVNADGEQGGEKKGGMNGN